VAAFWPYGEDTLDPSGLVIGLKLASFIFILLLSLEYKRLCPIMSRRERAEFRKLIKNPETRAKILEEAEIEGDPVPRVEKNTVSAPTASATQGAWDSDLARIRALACIPFENGADYSESDRFSVIYRTPFEPVAREPLSITELSVIDDLLSGRRLLRIKAKNNSPVAVRSASFRLVLADRSGSTIGEMHLPSVAVNLLEGSCEGFDNYAFVLPDETTFGVACITRVDLADGLYWDKGTEFYRFMTVSAPSAECAPDPAATPSEGDEQRIDVPVNDPAPEESN
jgi:hypothetical protein